MSMDKTTELEEITGLIPESQLENSISADDAIGAGSPAIIAATAAVTAVTVTSPCPSSACSKDC
ncbi:MULTISPECIES: class II lanthipeptide, LchA2/BrtA2 family [Staphylococcus]|uniref:class II lanthipeptide, LchA2/BrtA2 family n=1 Tax=Staphylococcus TaxID=1279 RepID=UPI0021B354AF|nr:class II lanthipeptide, LchA2/BrtA2 family [Staphylococcus haemolyticus]